MSTQCQICKKSFQFPYLLRRHLAKKIQCKIPNRVRESVEYKVEKLEEKILEHSEIFEELQLQKAKQSVEIDSEKYTCRFCLKQFSCSANLSRHIKKKRCKGKNDNVELYERELGIVPPECSKYQCRFCKTVYTKQSSYSRHMNSECKEKIKYEHDLEKQVLQNRREVLEKKQNEVINKSHNIKINGSQNNVTTNNNNTNIFLPPMNAFGNENLDYITTKMLLKQIELCTDFSDITETVKTFTQLIHAHPAHPENHNVLFSHIKSPFAQIYNGSEFVTTVAMNVEDTILRNVKSLIIDKKDEYCKEQEKLDKPIAKTIDNKLCKLECALIDNIDEELHKEKLADSTRNLSLYRNSVKGSLLSKKEDIDLSQQLKLLN
jgi:hypothetical protein